MKDLPIGRIVAIKRAELGLTQKEVADACGMDGSAISRLEDGTRNPSMKTLHRLAKLFKVSVPQLLSTQVSSQTPTQSSITN